MISARIDGIFSVARFRAVPAQAVTLPYVARHIALDSVRKTSVGWQWKFDPAHAPTAAPELSETRTAIDGFNSAMVIEMAARRDVLFGPGCATALDDARGGVAAARALDPLYRQALDVATSSYCR